MQIGPFLFVILWQIIVLASLAWGLAGSRPKPTPVMAAREALARGLIEYEDWLKIRGSLGG